MGAFVCCGESHLYKSSNLHLFQINRYYSEKTLTNKMDIKSPIMPESQRQSLVSTDTINNNSKISSTNIINSRKKTLKNQNGEFELLSYDIDQGISHEYKIIFPIIKSIEGLSEITIKEEDFYLCGISSKQNNEGSFLFKISLVSLHENELNAEILINLKIQKD